jgi:hypothetical protein
MKKQYEKPMLLKRDVISAITAAIPNSAKAMF